MITQQALFCAGGLTTPNVAANTTSTGSGTTQTVSLPAHISGQLLLVFFATPSNPTHTINSGSSVGSWSQIQYTLLGSTLRFSSYKCLATGSDMSLVLDVSVSQTHRSISYAIYNADTVNYGTYVQVNAAGTPNPPTLTVTNTPRNAAFFVVTYCTLTTYNPTAISANYIDNVRTAGTGGTVITGHRNIASATSDDPGAWTGNISTSLGLTNTYAVYKL